MSSYRDDREHLCVSQSLLVDLFCLSNLDVIKGTALEVPIQISITAHRATPVTNLPVCVPFVHGTIHTNKHGEESINYEV